MIFWYIYIYIYMTIHALKVSFLKSSLKRSYSVKNCLEPRGLLDISLNILFQPQSGRFYGFYTLEHQLVQFSFVPVPRIRNQDSLMCRQPINTHDHIEKTQLHLLINFFFKKDEFSRDCTDVANIFINAAIWKHYLKLARKLSVLTKV